MPQPTEDPARRSGPTRIGAAGAPWLLRYQSVDRVRADPHPRTVSPGAFERQMGWLRARGLRGVSVRELLDARDAGAPDAARGLVGLTFDDGYADFATRAVPVLLRYGFTATVFMVSGRMGRGSAWEGGPGKSLMTPDQLRTVTRAGMEVGSHGRSHAALPGVADAELATELEVSRLTLEDVIGGEVVGFAYPYGRVTSREIAAARAAGYGYACAGGTCAPGGPIVPGGRFALPRARVGEREGRLLLGAKLLHHEWRTRSRV
ncbi:polysaccharide deacetylase family protein [Spirillospora albida]|uniref:polysaccharide deacetylase family protein n=1 Tax=Spirillospora albida TaxID=58123 RepID=UPI000A529D1F|nr:polysaccharide deacetylase family protein [Spirillospora albida]